MRLVALCLALNGCWNCTYAMCRSGLSLQIEGTELEPGDYLVAVDHADGSAACSFTVIDPAADTAACGFGSPCVVDDTCGLSVGDVLYVWLDVLEGPLQIAVTRDGQLSYNEAAAPVWSESQPNGPHCGPVCSSAEHVIAW